MENKKPWLSYDKISNLSDAFSYIKDIGFDLNDSFEHLNQGSPVRAKGIPTENTLLEILMMLRKVLQHQSLS